jgi:hypothetical protein
MPQVQGIKAAAVDRLPQGLDNAGDAVSAPFLQGKQHSKKSILIGLNQRFDLMRLRQSTLSLSPSRLTNNLMCCLCNDRVEYLPEILTLKIILFNDCQELGY